LSTDASNKWLPGAFKLHFKSYTFTRKFVVVDATDGLQMPKAMVHIARGSGNGDVLFAFVDKVNRLPSLSLHTVHFVP
jgi:hypothetical protein